MTNFFSSEIEAIEEFATEEGQLAWKAVKAGFLAVKADIKANGVTKAKAALDDVEAAVVGKSGSAAGTAALAVLGTDLVKDAAGEVAIAADAAKAVWSESSAHVIATSAATAVTVPAAAT